MQRPSVDLPQPDSPTSPSVSPRASSRSTPSTARSTVGGRPAQPAGRLRRAARSASSRSRTSSSGSGIGDHRLAPRVLGAGLVVDDRPRRGRRRASISGIVALEAVRPARTGSADGSGSRRAARRGRAVRPGSTRGGRGRSSKSGTERSRPSVYGCRGSRKTASTVPVSTTWPAYITATRWQVCAITARSCETKTRLTPSSSRSAREQLQDLVLDRHVERRRRLVAEDQLAGRRRARSRSSTRWRMPPDSSCGYAPVAALRVGDADQAHQLERALRARGGGCSRAARAALSAICSPTRITGFSAVIGSWKIIATRACRAARAASAGAAGGSVGAVEPDRCRRRSAPRAGSRPTSARSAIVLPEPDSPTRPSASPALRRRTTRRRRRAARRARAGTRPRRSLDLEQRRRSFGPQQVGEAVGEQRERRAR